LYAEAPAPTASERKKKKTTLKDWTEPYWVSLGMSACKNGAVVVIGE
jgi:hypothetical protein